MYVCITSFPNYLHASITCFLNIEGYACMGRCPPQNTSNKLPQFSAHGPITWQCRRPIYKQKNWFYLPFLSPRTPRSSLYYFFYSFIHSGHFYSAPSSPLLLRGAPDYSTDTVSEFHAEAHRQL